MRNKTTYEWTLELVDEYGDIQEAIQSGKLSDLLADYRAEPEGEIARHDLCLVQDIGNEEAGLEARGWVYVKDWTLDDDGDFDAPQRYAKELARASKCT